MRYMWHVNVLILVNTPIILITAWWLVKYSGYGQSPNSRRHYVAAQGVFDPQEFVNAVGFEDIDLHSNSTSRENSVARTEPTLPSPDMKPPEMKEPKESSDHGLSIADTISRSDYLIAARVNNYNESNEDHSSGCVSEVSILDCGNMGLAALLLATLDHLVFCSLHTATPTVMWKNCGSLCSNNSLNSWEWYFEPVNPGIEKQASKVICLAGTVSHHSFPVANERLFKSWWRTQDILDRTKHFQFTPKPILSLSFQKREVTGFENFGTISTDVRHWVNALLKKYIRVKKSITEEVDVMYNDHMLGYSILGVHIRGTDHWVEREQQNLVPLRAWVKKAKKIFESLEKPRKIFVASDNNEAIKYFLKIFGKNTIIFIKAVRARHYNGPAIHVGGLSPQRIGSEVLKDILLLAKCQHFLHGESSVAALASYFNPNMTSHLIGGDREIGDKQTTNSSVEHQLNGETGYSANVTRGKTSMQKHKIPSREKLKVPQSMDDPKTEALEALTCFKKNSPYSACPSLKNGAFINLEEIPIFLDNEQSPPAHLFHLHF